MYLSTRPTSEKGKSETPQPILISGLMYCMQAENMVDIVGEMGYSGSNKDIELKQELRQLRQILKENSAVKGYWENFYGTSSMFQKPGKQVMATNKLLFFSSFR